MVNHNSIQRILTIGALFLLASLSIFRERQTLCSILQHMVIDPSSYNAQEALYSHNRPQLKLALRPSEFHFRRENASNINWTDDDYDAEEIASVETMTDPDTLSSSKISTTTRLMNNTTSNHQSDGSEVLWSNHVQKSITAYDSVKINEHVRGEILNGKLIVNVNHTYMFWMDGQTKLCNLLQKMTLKDDWDTPRNDTGNQSKPLLNATMNCTEMVKQERFGQGNWVTALYCVRVAAAKAQVDFQFQCSDGRDSQENLLLPWFDGYYSAPNASHSWPYTGTLPTQVQACTPKYPQIRVDKMADQITDRVRNMAVTLVGSSDATRRHAEVPLDQPPLIPNVVLDDVVIHFRCGDIMGGGRRTDFGMIKFMEYLKWISPEARSIGILTQPFDASRNRRVDRGRVSSCRNATYLLVETLQGFLPETRIAIHNGPNETLPLAYARLVMANQSFTTLSSFGIFPVIGTFGHGYFQRGNRGVNPFANFLPELMPNLHMMTAPVLTMGAMRNMNLTSILEWLSTPEALISN
jgi:hypothetical protein